MPIQMQIDEQSIHSVTPTTGKATLSLVVQHGTPERPDEEYLAVEVVCSEERVGDQANGIYINICDLDDNLVMRLEVFVRGTDLYVSEQCPRLLQYASSVYEISRTPVELSDTG